MQSEQVGMPYEAWRITYQSSEQAARAAHAALQSLGARITALEGELATLQAGLQAAAPNAPLYDPREVAFSAQAAPQAVQAAEGVPSHYRNALPPYRVVSAEEHRAETEHAKHYGLEHLVPRRTPLYTHPTQQGMDAREGRTDAEIVERTEAAARFLLSWAFSQEPEDAKSQLRHSQNTKAQSAWVAACKVQEILTDSDAANAAQEIDCDLPVVPKLPDARPKPRLHDFEIIGHFVSAEMKHKSDELADSVAWLKSRDTICANKNGFGCEHSCKPGACCQIAAQAKQGGAA